MECSTVKLSELKPRKLSWLWGHRMPLAKLVMLAGDPGIGKSYFTTWLAARVTNADAFPDGPTGLRKPADVVFLSAEDDATDTILPRCQQAGVDLARMHVIDGVVRGEAREEGFSLDRHLEALEATLRKLERPRLVVIDPVSAYMGDVDSNSNTQVRGVLRGLADLAHKYGPTILCVTHLSKSQLGGTKAVYRTMGSLAFVAAARLAYYVSTVQNEQGKDTGERCIAMVKNNIGPLQPSMTYSITDAGFQWMNLRSQITVEQLERGTLEAAGSIASEGEDLLRELLSQGPRKCQDVIQAGERKGISAATMNRAKNRLGVRSKKEGSGWVWELAAKA